MKLTELDDQVSVSDQIKVPEVTDLFRGGVEVVVCNRPDREAAEQPAFEEINHACEALGMEARHIPFVGDAIGDQELQSFLKLLHSGKRIHAYCRSGARSSKLWAQARTKQEMDPEEIINRARLAGVDVSRHVKSPHSQAREERAMQKNSTSSDKYDVVVVGGGSGGISVTNSLLKRNGKLRIAIIEPATEHYYQPGWTMVGGGVFRAPQTRRQTRNLIPGKATWLNRAAVSFAPEQNEVELEDGMRVSYSQLVVTPGLKLNWEAVEGLSETLGKNGVTSNYRYDLAPYTWELVRNLKQGTAVFTQPPMPIKCAGAPQKAMYLSADHWLRSGVLGNIKIDFFNAGGVLFGVPAYVPALQSYVDKYGANVHYNHNLVKIDGTGKRAWFKHTDTEGNEQLTETEFDMIHVCPPQCAPDFISTSVLADNAGWLDVDQFTLRHKSYGNIWGLGDVMNTPNAKTMAAVRKQVPVVAQNIVDVMAGQDPACGYDGYGSCPLTVERGRIVLAEFGYGGKLLPTFPDWVLEGTKPTRAAWILKTRILPDFYWHAMLKGREWMVAPQKLQ